MGAVGSANNGIGRLAAQRGSSPVPCGRGCCFIMIEFDRLPAPVRARINDAAVSFCPCKIASLLATGMPRALLFRRMAALERQVAVATVEDWRAAG